MEDAPEIGPRLKALRKQRGMTLDELEAQSGVSQSTLSKIERDETNPTYGTLWNITRALDADISALTSDLSEAHHTSIDVVQPHDVPEIKSKNGDCVLRILGPAHLTDKVEWYEITLGPKGVLASAAHAAGTFEHLTALDGAFEVIAGDATAQVEQGGAARYPADRPHEIRNRRKRPSKGLLVVIRE